jgi:hypothetical protein
MSRFDGSDWAAHLEKQHEKRLERRTVEAQSLKRMALSAGRVTGDEDWDRLLSVVQERIVTYAGVRDQALESIVKSDEFSSEALINQKLAIRMLGAQIEALEWVIGLPKELKENSDRANKSVESVGESAS